MKARFLDSIYVGVLILYVLAGVWLVPFHGDESTIIYMARDWYILTHFRDLRSVLYNPALKPQTQALEDQELRLLNGTLSKDGIGIGLSLAGITIDKLPGPWAWGFDWWVNRYYGHLPDNVVLFVSRLTSAWMTMLSVALVFVIARRLAGRGPAWIGTFVYATLPAVLLNGRRAVFEGATLLTLSLFILVAIELARRMRANRKTPVLRNWLLLGAAAGLAMAAKHTAIVVIGPAFIMLLCLDWKRLLVTIRDMALASVVAAIVFLALNPAWWGAPLQMPGVVFELRSRMMGIQSSFYDEFAAVHNRLTAPLNLGFGRPQYYEDAQFDWTQWIGGQISAYEAASLSGIDWHSLGVLTYVFPVIGLLALLAARNAQRLVFIGTTVFSTIAIVATNTLPWQRYYLPLSACLAVSFGIGVHVVVAYGWSYARRLHFPRPSVQTG